MPLHNIRKRKAAMLQVQGLTYQYTKNKLVLDDLTFKIEKGEFVALAGPNGCGKTTLIKIVCDLLKIQKGKVEFNGRNHQDLSVKREIIYLPSDDYLPEFLTGREYVQLLSKLYQQDFDQGRLHKLAQYYSMEDELEKLIEDYSHGMRKKIQIMSALVVRPKLMIIDETLNGIDIEAKEVTKLLLDRYVKDGGTVLLSTHDLSLVEEICERVILLYQGKIHLDEKIKDLGPKYGKDLSSIFKEIINYEELRDEIQSS